MEPLDSRPLLLALVALAVVVAGCAENTQDPAAPVEGAPPATPPSLTDDQAKALLAGAAADMPSKFGFDFSVTNGSGDVLATFSGNYDNVSKSMYLEANVDPKSLGPTGASASSFLKETFIVFFSPQGAYYRFNETAYAFPADATGQGGIPMGNPFEEFISPEEGLGFLDELGDVSITSVQPVAHRGKPAYQLAITSKADGENATGKVVVFADPRRIAEFEMTGPSAADPKEPADKTTMRAVFYYGDEVKLQTPPGAARILGLAYTSGAGSFFGSGSDPKQTWTFLGDAGIALAEVEVHVKAPAEGSTSDPGAIARAPNQWTMKLSDGNKTQGGLTIAFHDRDANGKVSRNDTLVIDHGSSDTRATILLYDTQTKLYVVPGVGLALLVAAVGALALALRRRG